jgi:predicted transcriptional regulator
MTRKMGRPPKEKTKSVNIGLRITEETANKLQRCADSLKASRTQVIEKGIDMVDKSISKK